MDYHYDQAIAILRRTPATLSALLRDLPDAWTTGTEGPNSWSAYDVVGHLLHSDEANWIARARIILDHGEARPFDDFNRTAMFEKYHDAPLTQLLAAFAETRAANLATLDGWQLTPEQLRLTGTHPALGRVTLSNLLSTWVVHDLNHIGQIVEVMARQYNEAVGPWRANLAILTRPILTE